MQQVIPLVKSSVPAHTCLCGILSFDYTEQLQASTQAEESLERAQLNNRQEIKKSAEQRDNKTEIRADRFLTYQDFLFFPQISTQSITVSHTLIKTQSVVHDQPLQTSNYTSPLSFLSVTPFGFKNKSCTAVSAFLNVMGIKPGARALCRLTRR